MGGAPGIGMYLVRIQDTLAAVVKLLGSKMSGQACVHEAVVCTH